MTHSRICAAISAFEACYARSDKAALGTGSARSKTLIAKAEIRIGPLVNSGDVKTEIGRVYRQARRGQLDTSEATRLVYMLRVLLTAIETTDFERRLDALETVTPSQHLRRIA